MAVRVATRAASGGLQQPEGDVRARVWTFLDGMDRPEKRKVGGSTPPLPTVLTCGNSRIFRSRLGAAGTGPEQPADSWLLTTALAAAPSTCRAPGETPETRAGSRSFTDTGGATRCVIVPRTRLSDKARGVLDDHLAGRKGSRKAARRHRPRLGRIRSKPARATAPPALGVEGTDGGDRQAVHWRVHEGADAAVEGATTGWAAAPWRRMTTAAKSCGCGGCDRPAITSRPAGEQRDR
ncbi:hypothetical protein FrEUN1fDRAFT_4300 [Parafrankia sp. EUN1f]|nr:hypothetical protein FrEUN1fDRAFT_4300 [Parafrankia sp. EUN1f]